MSGERARPHVEVVASTRRQFSRELKLAVVAEAVRRTPDAKFRQVDGANTKKTHFECRACTKSPRPLA